MELIVLLFAISLLHTEGSSAVTPVFVKKGEDVLLDVMKADGLEDFSIFEWNSQKTIILVRFQPGKDPVIFPDYTERLEFSVKNYSVTLKNLQHTDSGVYTARAALLTGDKTLAEYNVTVQDPVSQVILTVGPASRSSNSCNVTVTCRTQDSHINSTFRCENQTCSQEEGEQSKVTTTGASLKVELDLNGSIICNHSNQVSRTEDIKMIKGFCLQHAGLDNQPNIATVPVAVIVVLVVILIVVVLLCSFLFYRRRRKNKKESIENTVYEVPQIGSTAQPPDQRQKRDVSELSPTSTYCLVGPHTGSVGSTETGGTSLPESLYAQVEKPVKPSQN